MALLLDSRCGFLTICTCASTKCATMRPVILNGPNHQKDWRERRLSTHVFIIPQQGAQTGKTATVADAAPRLPDGRNRTMDILCAGAWCIIRGYRYDHADAFEGDVAIDDPTVGDDANLVRSRRRRTCGDAVIMMACSTNVRRLYDMMGLAAPMSRN